MANVYSDKPTTANKLSMAAIKYYLPLSALAMVLIFAAGYVFLLRPKYEQIRSSGSFDQETLNAGVTKRQNYLNDIRKLNDNYSKINQSEIERLKKILPSEADIAGLFASMQILTTKSGILLTSINIAEAAETAASARTPSAAASAGDIDDGEGMPAAATATRTTAASGKIGKLNITLNLQGSENNYSDIKAFLTALENNLRLFDVNAVFFSPGSPAFSISLTTYYAKN